MSFMEFAGFSFHYAQSSVAALKDISLEVKEGEILIVCGRSGSGKSTLLRCMKREITPAGQITGRLISKLASQDVAVVFQDPETQLMCGSVLEDLAFYMENLGYSREDMRHNMAETVGFFGLETLLHRDPNELSGGQKQMVTLCAALMTMPKLLLLDEPVSQLDPIAVRNFLDMLVRINAELGVTVVMTEHRLDDCLALADRLAVMDEGKILYTGETKRILRRIVSEDNNQSLLFVPEIPRLSLLMEPKREVCLTAKEFRRHISSKADLGLVHSEKKSFEREKLLALKNVFFAYEKNADFILRNLFLNIYQGERVCLMGGNGSGKTTLLKLLGKIIKPLSGLYRAKKLRIAYLPQNIQSYFRFESVKEEIQFSAGDKKIDEHLFDSFGLSEFLHRNPFDLSGGEAGKLALYCTLLQEPHLLLLDEPTKGIDPYAKRLLARHLQDTPTTVVCATHDLEFAARLATRCVMLFDGNISLSSTPREFFSQNQYYTTALAKAIRPLCRNAITIEDVIELCGKETPLLLRDLS